ncbi:neutral/alkaline non-lysosomal ceramidase N-terminal domain-containing protein [Paenibacillus hodogayensis]|uniref:Neutral/alkaline non-lysosomal ceramidase N-terminal domain-containing protein n=1 Tax=Paenibacillus hodogayensis TaxID=279208 RepID=A0ABV5VPM2_9BACL
MRFGVAKDLITPDQPAYMGGYASFFNQQFQGIHDDLYVRTLLVEDGGTKLVFVSLDLLFHDFALTEELQRWVETAYGIPGRHFFLAYSHTHGGPALVGYDDASQHSPAYERFLIDRIQSCVSRAMVNLFEGTLEAGGVDGDWNMNRRRLVDGKMQNKPNPEGAKDDRLHVLRVLDANGRTKVVLFNYACHPVTVRDTPYLSGDYPGRACHLIEAEYYGATGIFFQGAGGNSRPKATAYKGSFITCTYDEVNEMAASIVQAIKRLFANPKAMAPVQPKLAACQFRIRLELEPYPKRHFADIANDPDSWPGLVGMANRVFDGYESQPDFMLLPAGLIRLSADLYIAYMGGEPCYEVKQKLERLFPDVTLLFWGYADAAAYIPDDRILAEGGYEAEGSVVEYGLKGPFRPGIDARMAEAFTTAFRALQ